VLRNCLAAAVRNFQRNKIVALTSIVGLSAGFAAAILLALYVRYEFSFDQFVQDHQRVFRLVATYQPSPSTPSMSAGIGDHRMARWLELDFPEVEASTRMDQAWFSVGRNGIAYNEEVFVVDPQFFKVIPIPAFGGDLNTALTAGDSLVMTRSMARKYFGNEDPLGKQLEIEGKFPVHVTAVIEDLPSNSQFNFRLLVSSRAPFWKFLELDTHPDANGGAGAHVYFRVKRGLDPDAIRRRMQAAMPDFVRRHKRLDPGQRYSEAVQPLTDVHLSTDAYWNMTPQGNRVVLYALSAIAALIVTVALANFSVLAAARASQRSIEIGIRKLSGASRRDLVLQFVGESLLYVLIATVLAMAVVELALPYFQLLFDTGEENWPKVHIAFDYVHDFRLSIALAGMVMFAGVLAGLYPAFVMARLNPADSLRSSARRMRSLRRQMFVTLQIALLIAIMFATAVIYRQTQFVMNAGMRLDSTNVFYVWFRHGSVSQQLEDAVRELDGVVDVTSSISAPMKYTFMDLSFRTANDGEQTIKFSTVAFNWFEFYGLKPLAGRFFSEQRGSDRLVFMDPSRPWSLVLNETAARRLGFARPQDAIGKSIVPARWPTGAPMPAGINVIGVVADFPVDSLRKPIEPMAFGANRIQTRILHVRVRSNQIPQTIAQIEKLWTKYGEPGAVGESWLNEWYHQMYIDIIQQQRVLSMLALVAIFLAALGMFGLAIFIAQQRVKEIGIRKVMGAEFRDVMILLLWAFTRPVLWASAIAWPIAIWVMHRWLSGFAYRVDLGWYLLPVASLLALGISLLTVSVQSYVSARSKPVDAIRYE
jgi:putative ABC transport system permease protein